MNGEKAQVVVRPESIERGEFVREFRHLYRMELQALAALAELSEPALSLFETGQRNLSGSAWKRVLEAIQAVVNENADDLGSEYQRLSNEWATIQFFPILRDEEDVKQDRPPHLRNKPGQEWTAEDIDAWLSWPTRLNIIEKRQSEIMSALVVGESVRQLFPQADIEIEQELLRGEGGTREKAFYKN
jgi:transcriptional regulator with XRE-family HTH domain